MLVVTWSGQRSELLSQLKIHAATTTWTPIFRKCPCLSIACGEFSPVLGGGKGHESVIDRATSDLELGQHAWEMFSGAGTQQQRCRKAFGKKPRGVHRCQS